MTAVAVSYCPAIGTLELLEIFCLNRLVHGSKSRFIKALPTLVFIGLSNPCRIHGAVHVFGHVSRKRPIAVLRRLGGVSSTGLSIAGNIRKTTREPY